LTFALYGFAGYIPYNQIGDYAEANPNALFIEKQQTCQAQIAYAAKQSARYQGHFGHFLWFAQMCSTPSDGLDLYSSRN
jgi:hypothetical protein